MMALSRCLSSLALFLGCAGGARTPKRRVTDVHIFQENATALGQVAHGQVAHPEVYRGEQVDASIPNADAMMGAALSVLKARRLEMTVSLLDPAGGYIDRRKSAGALPITFKYAYYKFNFLKNNGWDTDRVCGAHDWACISASFLKVHFTKSFACPGAVVLYDNGRVVGVLALSGAKPIEDHEVAAAAAEAAGYRKMGQRAKYEFKR